jgi:hypothetical protein
MLDVNVTPPVPVPTEGELWVILHHTGQQNTPIFDNTHVGDNPFGNLIHFTFDGVLQWTGVSFIPQGENPPGTPRNWFVEAYVDAPSGRTLLANRESSPIVSEQGEQYGNFFVRNRIAINDESFDVNVDTNNVTTNFAFQNLQRRADFIGYHVYRGNIKLTEEPISALTYTINNVAGGNHLFRVSAAYAAGESIPATINVNVPTVLTPDLQNKDFGAVPVGAVSEAQEFRITNSSGNAILATFVIEGEDKDHFELLGDTEDVLIGGAGGSAILRARFAPKTTGPKAAEIYVYDNNGVPMAYITINGYAAAALLITVDPLEYDFGTVGVNNESELKEFTITNISSNPITLTLAVSGAGSAEFIFADEIDELVLAAGAKAEVEMLFAPQTAGAKIAELQILENDTILQVVALRGTGFALNPVRELEADVDELDVTLTWLLPAGIDNLENAALVGFRVYRDDVLVSNGAEAVLTFTDTVVEKDIYTYAVIAEYVYGDSDAVDIEVDFDVSDDDIVVVYQTGLGGNYPNPFNPQTTIRFSLASEAPVMIEVFNIRGQKVTTLVNESRPAGEHSVVWQGTDDNGRSVSSGLYFYRMTSNDYSSIRRMVLMK